MPGPISIFVDKANGSLACIELEQFQISYLSWTGPNYMAEYTLINNLTPGTHCNYEND